MPLTRISWLGAILLALSVLTWARGIEATPTPKETATRDLILEEARKEKLENDPATREKINNVLLQAWMDKNLSPKLSKIRISENDTRAYYLENPDLRTRQIFIPVSQPKAKETLEELKAKIEAGELSFPSAAVKFSQNPSAATGGNVDFISSDRSNKKYYLAAKALKENQISPPIALEDGWYLIQLTKKRSWSEADRSKIARALYEKKKEAVFEEAVRELREKKKANPQ